MDFVMSFIDSTTIKATLLRVPEHGSQVTNVLSDTYGSPLNTDESALQKHHQTQSFPNISTSHEPIIRKSRRENYLFDCSAVQIVGKSRRENDLYDCGSVQVGSNIIFHSSEIPKKAVAEGVLLSIDPYEKIENFALGVEFVKVVIKNAIKSDYLLLRPRRGVNTVGEAVGKSVAWEFVNVMEK